jgi:hypothetical protein
MLVLILEAALRSLLMAVAVWAGLRLFRLHHMLAQKIAWVMVLAAAVVMPVVMHSPLLAIDRAIKIPIQSVTRRISAFGRSAERTAAVVAKSSLVSSIPPIADQLSAQLAGVPASQPVRKPIVLKHIPAHAILSSAHLSPLNDASVSTIVLNPESAPRPAWRFASLRSWFTLSHLRSFALGTYFLVLGLLLLRALAGLVLAFRYWLRSEPVDGVLGAEPTASVRVSPDLTTPVTIGSTILLPSDYEQWDTGKLRIVLAHEQSHVRQRDFYLQLFAAVHAAIFWFSPLGWWLQRKLSDLGEALSDRAGLAEAADGPAYAQVLLEFAAAPHPIFTGVAMARSSNLSSRIERILSDSRFRNAFRGGRRHAVIAAVLVPSALVAAVALIRVVPAVHAADVSARVSSVHFSAQASSPGASSSPNTSSSPGASSSAGPSYAHGASTGIGTLQTTSQGVILSPGKEGAQIRRVNFAQAPPAPPAPEAPAPVAPDMVALQAPEAPEPPPALESDEAPTRKHGTSRSIRHSGDGDNDFSIVHENGDGTTRWNGEYNDEVARLRKKMNLHGDYIWFQRGGKYYVITDPAIVAKSDAMFREDPNLAREQAKLELQQAEMEAKMAKFAPDKIEIKVDTPEFKEQMKKLDADLAKLQKLKVKDLSDKITNETLADLQEKIGDIQGQIGDLQGRIGEEQGKLGEKQGEIGEQMGKIGEQMGRIGEQQGKNAEAATHQMRSVIDQAIKDGKAKPVE